MLRGGAGGRRAEHGGAGWLLSCSQTIPAPPFCPALSSPPGVVRAAAERGVGHAGLGAAVFVAPLLQNLALSSGDNEEVCYCLKAWLELPQYVREGQHPSRDDALKVRAGCGRAVWGALCCCWPLGAWRACRAWPSPSVSHSAPALLLLRSQPNPTGDRGDGAHPARAGRHLGPRVGDRGPRQPAVWRGLWLRVVGRQGAGRARGASLLRRCSAACCY